MSILRVGDILRVTRAVRSAHDKNLLSSVGWAVITHFNNSGCPEVKWLEPKHVSTPFLKRAPGSDKFTLSHVDELPDDAVAELARWQLSGGEN